MPSSFSDTSGKDVLDMEKRWKNFTNKAIDTFLKVTDMESKNATKKGKK